MTKLKVFSTIAICMIIALSVFIQKADAKAKYTIKHYCVAPPVSSVNTSMEKMSKFLKEESGGNLEMKIFPSGQLGPESQGLNSLKIGAVQSAAITAGTLSLLEPKANIMMLPYAFKTFNDLVTFSKSETLSKIGESLETKGIKLMGVGGYGFFNILSTKKHLTEVNEFKGLKIRVLPTPILVEFYKTLGAVPTPIAFPEVYTGLQQGVIGATDATLESSWGGKQYEVATYLTRTDHLYGWWLYLVNKAWYDKLPVKTQKLVSKGFTDYTATALNETKKFKSMVLKFYTEKKINMIQLSDEERNALRKKTYGIHEKYKDAIGPDLMNLFYKELNFKKPL